MPQWRRSRARLSREIVDALAIEARLGEKLIRVLDPNLATCPQTGFIDYGFAEDRRDLDHM